MLGRIGDILYVVWPVIAAILAIICTFLSSSALERMGSPRVSFFDVVTFDRFLPLAAYRVLCGILAIVFIVISSVRDYSTFFPEHLKMEVYFDDAGLGVALSHFPADDLKIYDIAGDWRARKARYFDQINADLRSNGVDFTFNPQGEGTTSSGETTFKVHQIGWGFSGTW